MWLQYPDSVVYEMLWHTTVATQREKCIATLHAKSCNSRNIHFTVKGGVEYKTCIELVEIQTYDNATLIFTISSTNWDYTCQQAVELW